jgi:putative ABC transport system permease protein
MMIDPRWRKVLRDIWANKRRTLLVVLSMAVGVFAVGTVTHMQVIVSCDMVRSYVETNPASATIYTVDDFDGELVRVVQRMPEVATAEGRRSIIVRFRLDDESEWYAMQLFAISDYDDMRLNIIRPDVEGPEPGLWPDPAVWPPPERELLLESTSILVPYLGLWPDARQGDTILIETGQGWKREVRLAGLVRDFTVLPATNAGIAYGYITLDTMEWLGEPREFNEMHIIVAGDRLDVDLANRVAGRVRDRIERSGVEVLRTQIPEPGKLPLDYQFRAVVLILGTLGVFALALGSALVVNTISAVLAHQVRQIGVMKAIGARTCQIAGLYLSMVLIYGLLSLCIAVPLGAVAARKFVGFMAYFINFDLSGYRLEPRVLAAEAAVGLLSPLLAALYPVVAGARSSVRKALDDYGVGRARARSTVINPLVDRVRGLSRPLLLGLRNTFRRRGRLALTLAALTLAGAILVSVASVQISLEGTLEAVLQYWKFDAQMQLSRPYRSARIEREAMSVPGIAHVECWGSTSAYRLRPDGSEGGSIHLLAPPAETGMIEPTVVQGRWLRREDEGAIVISTHLLAEEPDVVVGDEMVLKIGEREVAWRVVGVAQLGQPASIAYVNYPYFSRVVGHVGRASVVNVATGHHDPVARSQAVEALETRLGSKGMDVSSVLTLSQVRESTGVYFAIIIALLVMMSTLLAVVGGLGLMGTMSINVLERTREIAVMRAIGASDGAVVQVFVVEGVFIGLLSWLLGVILALPVGRLFSDAVGMQFLRVPLNYTYSVDGALLWFILVTTLSAVAAYLPARGGARISVSEALAYE